MDQFLKKNSGGKKREMSKLNRASVKCMDFSQQRVLEKELEMRDKYRQWEILMILFQEIGTLNQNKSEIWCSNME